MSLNADERARVVVLADKSQHGRHYTIDNQRRLQYVVRMRISELKNQAAALVDEARHGLVDDRWHSRVVILFHELTTELEAAHGPTGPTQRWWGVVWKPAGRKSEWLKLTTGHVDYYPSPALAQARVDDFFEPENCEVREFVDGADSNSEVRPQRKVPPIVY